MDYKKLLVLSYLSTVQASYSYQEICRLFGLGIEQVEGLFSQLVSEGYIILEKYYRISEKGREVLSEYKLDELDMFDMDEEEIIFVHDPISFDEIYIPKGFTKKIG